MVHAEAEDVLAAARVTCAGRANRLDKSEAHEVERYLRYVPNASRLLDFGDFAFYRIAPEALHWVGGFGDIHWIPEDAYRAPEATLNHAEAGIVEHMNVDHSDTLRAYCRSVHGREVVDAAMVGVDCDGFDVRADEALLRFDFATPATTPEAVRTALVDLAQRARTSE
jgi:putative heme iron utilization protein